MMLKEVFSWSSPRHDRCKLKSIPIHIPTFLLCIPARNTPHACATIPVTKWISTSKIYACPLYSIYTLYATDTKTVLKLETAQAEDRSTLCELNLSSSNMNCVPRSRQCRTACWSHGVLAIWCWVPEWQTARHRSCEPYAVSFPYPRRLRTPPFLSIFWAIRPSRSPVCESNQFRPKDISPPQQNILLPSRAHSEMCFLRRNRFQWNSFCTWKSYCVWWLKGAHAVNLEFVAYFYGYECVCVSLTRGCGCRSRPRPCQDKGQPEIYSQPLRTDSHVEDMHLQRSEW